MNGKLLAAAVFAAASLAAPLAAAAYRPTSEADVDAAAAPTAACVQTDTTLCLNNNRFAVTATYRTTAGASGSGTGVALTSDSGYFWFFGPTNIEVVVKVLNACTQDPARYWVFAAGLTNVEVTLTVTDTQAGGPPRVYINPLNTPFQPIQDTSAFATCP